MLHFSRAIGTSLYQARYLLKNPTGYRILRKIRRMQLSYLEMPALIDLYESVSSAESQRLFGVIVEAGTALGGSAIAMAAAKRPDRPMFIFDAFETIPPPSVRDGHDAHERYTVIQSGKAQGLRGGIYYGYRHDLREQVEQNFVNFGYPLSPHHIHLIKGYYVDTLRLNQPVVVAHLDCDWYDSVMTCLERIVPYLVVGGKLIIDDYQHWSGCKSAVDDYFANRKTGFEFVMKNRLHISRR